MIMTGPLTSRTAASVPKGTMPPAALRTLSCFRSSICRRNCASAWTLTCQVRRPKHVDEAIADLLLKIGLQLRGNLITREPRLQPVLEIIQHDEHRAEVRRVRVQQDRLAGNGHGMAYAFGIACDLFDLPH